MTVILDHSLLHLNIGLAGNQTEFLLDSGATHNFISSQWCSYQGKKVLIHFIELFFSFSTVFLLS